MLIGMKVSRQQNDYLVDQVKRHHQMG